MRIILFASLLSVPVLASAEFPQFFVGLKGGYQWGQDDSYNHSNPEGTILGVYGGSQFTPSWSWDLGYQHHNELKADVTSINVKTWLVESALRYDWYLQDKLSLYGRLGAVYWDMKKTQFSSSASDATGFSPFGEVGINYHLSSNVRLSTGYQYIDSVGKSNVGRYDSYGLLVSVAYTLGGPTQAVLVETAPTPIVVDIPVKDSVIVKTPRQTQIFSPKTTSELFGFDSIELSDESIEQLTEVLSVLITYPQAKVVVVGHTDSVGSASYNQKL
ncbi:outer membrane beta-barrel protein, partial [Vibrio cyclitrophicus]